MRAALVALVALGCEAPREWLGVSYDDRFGEATTMDVYAPESGGAGGAARPAVMFVHGGAWKAFSKSAHTRAAIRLARSGYVAATINYRLVPDGVFPRAYQDSACALAFLRAHADDYGLDPARVAVIGYSAGAHLAALLGVATDVDAIAPDCAAGRPGPPAAVVPGDGPLDLRRSRFSAVVDFLGGSVDDIPETYALASPITHVDAGEPPFLLVHAGADLLVDLAQSEDMRDVLVAAGNEARLLTLAGGGHLFNPDPDVGHLEITQTIETPEGWAAIADFLEDTLGPPP